MCVSGETFAPPFSIAKLQSPVLKLSQNLLCPPPPPPPSAWLQLYPSLYVGVKLHLPTPSHFVTPPPPPPPIPVIVPVPKQIRPVRGNHPAVVNCITLKGKFPSLGLVDRLLLTIQGNGISLHRSKLGNTCTMKQHTSTYCYMILTYSFTSIRLIQTENTKV